MDKQLLDHISSLTTHDYVCDIIRYIKSHSLLSIYAKKLGQLENEENFYITFGGVTYMECPIYWSGVGFYLGSQKECMTLLESIFPGYSIGLHGIVPNLFKVDLGNFSIKVAADKATVSKIPPWF